MHFVGFGGGGIWVWALRMRCVWCVFVSSFSRIVNELSLWLRLPMRITAGTGKRHDKHVRRLVTARFRGPGRHVAFTCPEF